MTFTIPKQTLLDALAEVSGAVEMRSTLPILSCVHLRVMAGTLTLETTNLDQHLTALRLIKAAKDGQCNVSFARLKQVIEAIQAPLLTATLDKDRLVLRWGTPDHCDLLVNADEFPPCCKLDAKSQSLMFTPALLEMIRSVAYAISNDETRLVLNGVLLEFKDDTLNVVATDGRRIVRTSTKVMSPFNKDKSVIVPSPAVDILLTRPLTSDVRMVIDSEKKASRVRFEQGDWTMATKTVEGTYPKYQLVIPVDEDRDATVTLNADALLSALTITALFTNDKSVACTLAPTKDGFHVGINTAGVGSSVVTVACRWNRKPVTINFNVEFLSNALQACAGQEVEMRFKDETSPVKIVAKNAVHVLMPMMK